MRRSDQRRDAVFALYQQDVTNRPLSALLVDAKPFTIELADGTDQHVGEIDEAVETAKNYSGTDAPGFVNGILGAAAREMEADAP